MAGDAERRRTGGEPPADVDSASSDAVLAGLDAEQRAAVTAPAGPVCILAGAGTGKTRAITHRIAHRVLTGEIQPRHVLAVTFTARAAAEMRPGWPRWACRACRPAPSTPRRCASCATSPRGCSTGGRCRRWWRARRGWSPSPPPRSGVRTDRTGARDLAGEIEWAKSCLVEPGDYAVAAAKARRRDAARAGQGGRGLRRVRAGQALVRA